MEEIKAFWTFIKENKSKVLTLLVAYQILEIYLGSVNYYYIDDIDRRVTGVTDFARTYARYLSEAGSWLMQGSRHLTDLGLTSFILSGLILTLTSTLAIYLVSETKKMSWITTFASLFIGINPWVMELMSFKYDSPFMMLSILISFLPFLFLNSNRLAFASSVALSIFLMFNSYQGSSGIFIVIILILSLQHFIKTESLLSSIEKLTVGAVGYVIGLAFYVIELSLLPGLAGRGRAMETASLSELPMAIFNNWNAYLVSYREGLPRLWKFLILIIVLVFIYQIVVNSKTKIKALLLTIVTLTVSSIATFGIYLAHADIGLIVGRPRYGYGLAVMLGLITVYTASRLTIGLRGNTFKLVIGLLIYYAYSFSLGYVASLDNQKTDFEEQSAILSSHLTQYISEENQLVYINHLFEDSPAFLNAKKNYTMLEKLVPSNESTYWPNVMWYNEITHSSVNFTAYNFANEDLTTFVVLEETSHFSILKKEGQIYVIMKKQNPDTQFQKQLEQKV